MRRAAGAICLCLTLGLFGCSRGGGDGLPPLAPTSTPAPYPTPQALSPQFEPIDGAAADFGTLAGGVYNIEIPEQWNGSLVVYFHGSQRFTGGNTGTVTVERPPLRADFISKGYAWAATSYDTNEEISGSAARQSAVLWDYFARKYGRPTHTYAVGDSMGGAGAMRAAEVYADRFSGALVSCGIAGVISQYDVSADLIAAGGYAVGVTQQDFETTSPIDLIGKRILPALALDPSEHARFLDAWIEMTGGTRPLGVEGYTRREEALWSRAEDDLTLKLSDNTARTYQFSPGSSIDQADFNSKALRVSRTTKMAGFDPGDPTGAIKVPVLMVHTTGDGLVPLSEFNLSVRRITDSGKRDLLSLRTFSAAGHCQLTTAQENSAFDDLVQWVEKGTKPPDEFDLPSGN